MTFTDADFATALRQSETPDMAGFDLFIDHAGIRIYRRFKTPAQDVFEVLVLGEISTDLATVFAMYKDFPFRMTWDDRIVEMKCVDEKEHLHYARVSPPWPLNKRDFVYVLESRPLGAANDTIVTLGKATTSPAHPEVKNVIRVTDYCQALVLRSTPSGATQVYLTYFEDPKGGIPETILKFAAKKGIPQMIDKMNKALGDYAHKMKK